jgi:hypothetical protein
MKTAIQTKKYKLLVSQTIEKDGQFKFDFLRGTKGSAFQANRCIIEVPGILLHTSKQNAYIPMFRLFPLWV